MDCQRSPIDTYSPFEKQLLYWAFLKPNYGTSVNHAAQIFHQVPGILGPTWLQGQVWTGTINPPEEWKLTRPEMFSCPELGV